MEVVGISGWASRDPPEKIANSLQPPLKKQQKPQILSKIRVFGETGAGLKSARTNRGLKQVQYIAGLPGKIVRDSLLLYGGIKQ
jgi:hypothetical protein